MRIVLAAYLLCCFHALAQNELSTLDAPPIFKSKVNLVLVPVVVRDRAGKPVGNLRKEDFTLFDKGKPQVIAKFSIEKSGGALAVNPVRTTDAPAGQPTVNTASQPSAPLILPDHFVAYLFDDVHVSFGDLVQSREAAWRHLQASTRPTDRAAIYTASGQTMLDFTDDRDKLHETLLRMRPRSIARSAGQECPDISFYMADLIRNKNDTQALDAATAETMVCANMDAASARNYAQSKASQVLSAGEHETRIALSVLKDAVRRVTAMPGERILVMVSPGFIRLTDQLQDEADIIDRAIRGNVTVSAIDARGLYTDMPDISKRVINANSERVKQQYDREAARASADVLAELADGTGGTFVQNTNDLDRGFREVSATPEVYYVLGFSPQNIKLDGSYHSLKVSLTHSGGLTAKARRGYYAPRHLTDADEEAKEEISQALFSRDEMRDIPVELHTQFFKTSETQARLVVLARLDVRKLRFKKVEGRNRDDVVVVAGIFDNNGNYLQGLNKKVEMRLTDDTLETKLSNGVTVRSDFKVGPGRYVIRLVVRDAEGQMMAAQNGAVEIP